ncbi:hypothetical protein [Lactobacillus johnsonii]|uniref:hypothetical protein n=1 Tax=Lactobacillus johnsonii TaxID=33959 RepID=UPI001FB1D3A9|nr:hypothetical protein [Lactobacillus johnsonii]UOC05463.1 hypothetical protein LC811_06415 [Lactobacillus johnsonii]
MKIRKFRVFKNDRGVKFSFQKSKKLDLQKLMGGYIFHFKNRFFSKGENLAMPDFNIFHVKNDPINLNSDQVCEIRRIYDSRITKSKYWCPFCDFHIGNDETTKIAELEIPTKVKEKNLYHGYIFSSLDTKNEWDYPTNWLSEIRMLVKANNCYGLYREITDSHRISSAYISIVKRCPKCNRRLTDWEKDLLYIKSTP